MLEMERGSGTESADGMMQVLNEFRAPEGVDAADVDAATDGQLMAVLDLRQDESLAEEGLGREVVNRVQKLRKKAGLVPEDAVNVYLGMDSRLASALSSQVRSRVSSTDFGYADMAKSKPNLVIFSRLFQSFRQQGTSFL